MEKHFARKLTRHVTGAAKLAEVGVEAREISPQAPVFWAPDTSGTNAAKLPVLERREHSKCEPRGLSPK